MALTYRALAALLNYPTTELQLAIPQIAATLQAEAMVPAPALAALRPLLDRLAGATYVPPPRFLVRSGFQYRKKAGRREYVRVQFDGAGDAQRYPKEGAGILTSLTESDALMELPEDLSVLAPGDLAPCIPLGLLLG